MRWQTLPSFAGFIIANVGAVLKATQDVLESRPTFSVGMYLNELYFGPVTFEITPENRTDSIKEQLPLISAGAADIRSLPIIHANGEGVPPFFVGTGNVDYLCANCSTTLVKSAWKASLHKIIIECPQCTTLNLTSAIEAELANKVILKGTHIPLSGPVNLKLGISLWGER